MNLIGTQIHARDWLLDGFQRERVSHCIQAPVTSLIGWHLSEEFEVVFDLNIEPPVMGLGAASLAFQTEPQHYFLSPSQVLSRTQKWVLS